MYVFILFGKRFFCKEGCSDGLSLCKENVKWESYVVDVCMYI